ncbi:SDR family NAD(P)-dependent oxidoreductase [Streptomyces griseoluteus]
MISNAGIQRRVGIAADDTPWAEAQHEIDVLLAGPVHLARLLTPHLLGHGRPSVYVNVTSGGAFLPQPFAPLYSAAKAALHSYTVNLRHALRATPCRVVELVPPAVATQLAGPGPNHGADPDEFCDTVFPLLDGSHPVVGYGPTAQPDFTGRVAAEHRAFEAASPRFDVPLYRPDGTVAAQASPSSSRSWSGSAVSPVARPGRR